MDKATSLKKNPSTVKPPKKEAGLELTKPEQSDVANATVLGGEGANNRIRPDLKKRRGEDGRGKAFSEKEDEKADGSQKKPATGRALERRERKSSSGPGKENALAMCALRKEE